MTKRTTDACPYCGSVFDNPPKRQTACKGCGNECYIRSKQEYIDSAILKKEEALAVDFLKKIEADPEEYSSTKKFLQKKWNTKNVAPFDISWTISNTRSLSIAKLHKSSGDFSGMYYDLKMLSFSQAEYMLILGHDDYIGLLSQVARYDALAQYELYRQAGVECTEFEVEAKGCCTPCAKHDGEKYTLKQIQNKRIIPFSGCVAKYNGKEVGWCFCMLYPVRV